MYLFRCLENVFLNSKIIMFKVKTPLNLGAIRSAAMISLSYLRNSQRNYNKVIN